MYHGCEIRYFHWLEFAVSKNGRTLGWFTSRAAAEYFIDSLRAL